MKIRTLKEIENSKYVVQVQIEDLSQVELDKITKFGDPEVNVGGFYGSEEDDATSGYTLPDSYERLKTSFHDGVFCLSFDERDHDDAEQRADSWNTTIVNRIKEAVTALREREDTFSEEVVDNF